MADNYSTYNSLMKHIRSKGIAIKGSVQKKNLKNFGCYHGYKGYRFKGDFSHKLAFDSFEQINAVIEFDNALKAALYSPLMKLETAIKSHVYDVKIRCVKKLFTDLSDLNVQYHQVTTFEDLLDIIS